MSFDLVPITLGIRDFPEKAKLSHVLALSHIILSRQIRSEKAKFLNFWLRKSQVSNSGIYSPFQAQNKSAPLGPMNETSR